MSTLLGTGDRMNEPGRSPQSTIIRPGKRHLAKRLAPSSSMPPMMRGRALVSKIPQDMVDEASRPVEGYSEGAGVDEESEIHFYWQKSETLDNLEKLFFIFISQLLQIYWEFGVSSPIDRKSEMDTRFRFCPC